MPDRSTTPRVRKRQLRRWQKLQPWTVLIRWSPRSSHPLLRHQMRLGPQRISPTTPPMLPKRKQSRPAKLKTQGGHRAGCSRRRTPPIPRRTPHLPRRSRTKSATRFRRDEVCSAADTDHRQLLIACSSKKPTTRMNDPMRPAIATPRKTTSAPSENTDVIRRRIDG